MASSPARLVLLPGMDGTGVLFDGLLRALAPSPAPVVISYPVDVMLDLEGLTDFVEQRLPHDEPFVLLGESFSGPVAVRLAARRPADLVGLVLTATFLRYPPASSLLWRALVRDVLFHAAPPAALIRLLLAGFDAPAVLVDESRDAIRRVTPAVMAGRLRVVLSADVRADLSSASVPVLYLGGSRDRLVGPWAARQVRTVQPATEVVTMDAPHLVLQRCPELAASAIRRFVGRCHPDDLSGGGG